MRTLATLFLLAGITLNARAGALDTWTNVNNSPYGDFSKIVSGNGRLWAISNKRISQTQNSAGFSYSSDGIRWTNTQTVEIVTGIAYGNGEVVTSHSDPSNDNDGGAIVFTDGTNGSWWFLGPPGLVGGVVFGNGFFQPGNGIFVTTGYFYEMGQGVTYVSTNGSNWTGPFTVGTNFQPSRIIFDGYDFYISGSTHFSSSNVFTYFSDDGTNWDDVTPPNPQSGKPGLAMFNSIDDKDIFVSGTNFYVWDPSLIQLIPPIPAIKVPAAGTNSLYLSFGGPGIIYSSTNFYSNWVTHATGLTNQFTCAAYTNGHVIIGGTGGAMFISGNAAPSLAVTNLAPLGIQLTVSGGLGPMYHLQASTNFSSWTNLAVFTNFVVSTQYVDTASNFAQRYYRVVSP